MGHISSLYPQTIPGWIVLVWQYSRDTRAWLSSWERGVTGPWRMFLWGRLTCMGLIVCWWQNNTIWSLLILWSWTTFNNVSILLKRGRIKYFRSLCIYLLLSVIYMKNIWSVKCWEVVIIIYCHHLTNSWYCSLHDLFIACEWRTDRRLVFKMLRITCQNMSLSGI